MVIMILRQMSRSGIPGLCLYWNRELGNFVGQRWWRGDGSNLGQAQQSSLKDSQRRYQFEASCVKIESYTYLSNFVNVFNQIAKCISLNCQMYLSISNYGTNLAIKFERQTETALPIWSLICSGSSSSTWLHSCNGGRQYFSRKFTANLFLIT